MKRIDAVVFDADGTLLDSRELIMQAYEHVLTSHGYPLPSRQEIIGRMGKVTDDNYAEFAPGHDPKRLTVLHREFQSNRPDLLAMYEGLHDMLEALKAAGLKIGMCTNRGSNVFPLLEHARIREYFDAIVHFEMMQKAKPDPEGLRWVLGELQVEPQHAVMVGDADADVGAGKAAGVAFTVGITHGFATREMLLGYGADHVVDRLDEILPLVLPAA